MSDWGRGSVPFRRRGSRFPFFLIGLILGIAIPVALVIFGPRYGMPVENIVSYTVSNENAQLKARIEGLERQLSLAEETLADRSEPSSTGDTGSANGEEIERLRAQLKLAEDVTTELQNQLDRAFNADIPKLKDDIEAREFKIEELEGEIERLAAIERDYKRLKFEQPAGGIADQTAIRSLEAELKKRDAALAQADDEIARLSAAERELQALRADNPAQATKALQEELDRERGRTAAFQKEINKLGKEIAARDDMLGKLDAEFSRLEPLEKEVEDLRARLAIADKTAQDEQARLQTTLDETRDALDAARRNIATRDTELARLRQEKARAASAGGGEPVAKATEEPEPTSAEPERQNVPRDPFRVAEAMRDARGLDDLGDADRDRIANGLIEGQCVTRVLSDAFERPPALAVRDLISALESDC